MARREAEARGVVLTWLIAALLMGATTLGLLLRERNRALVSRNEGAAEEALRRAQLALAVPLGEGREEDTVAALRALRGEGGIREVVLLRTRAASPELAFVRAVDLVAHSDPEVMPGPLRPRAARDALTPPRAKALYDWATRVESRSGRDRTWSRPTGGGETLEVGMALASKGTSYVLGLRWAPVEQPPGVPALGLVLILLVGLGFPAAQRFLGGRWRWLASAGGVSLAAVGCGLLLAGFAAEAPTAGPGTGFFQLLQSGLSQGVPRGGPGMAWVAVTLVCLALPFLGFLGLGNRAASAARQHRIAFAYILPAALGMLVLVMVPFLIGLGLGFFNHCDGRYEWVGLDNFVTILSGGGTSITDPLNFWFTLGVTLLWTFLNVLLHVSIGLALALLLKDPLLAGKGIYRVLLIIPWAVPNYITALMWKGMFHQQFGAVNQVLGLFGVEGVSWFSHFWSAFTANVVTNTWLGFPFMMVVALGALQSIPGDLYEAAEVDGASRFTQFTRITLPLLKPALLPAVILGSVWTFNQFNVIYLVSGGEPAGSTDILITEAYRWAFIRHERYGLAAAYATLIFLILLGYTLITNRVAKGAEGAMD
ncbi:MAG: sugar ABC transporter permease [Polyangia bacterium]|jgi:ABC-type sugar transport system permease subunit|nr:sugar ABC transporter permease [Polyangia bacterium]